MKNIEEHILRYPDLALAQQNAVDAHMAGHPEQAALLEEVKAVERLLEQARAFDASVPGDAALAQCLATPRSGTPPPGLEEGLQKIEAALDGTNQDAALRERCAALARRLRALDAESADPPVHFEELTGRALEAASEGPERSLEAAPPPGTPAAAKTPGVAAVGPAPLRSGTRLQSLFRLDVLPRAVRYGAVAVLALALAYGALFMASRLSQSQTERLAAVASGRLQVEGYSLRGMRSGSAPAADSAQTGAATGTAASLGGRYLRGLGALRAARTTTLGLFPRYDETQLQRARRQLETVVREAEAGSFIQLEALFFLGKARLAQGDKAGATAALRKVVAGEGRLAPEAQQILAALYEDAAYDGPPAG